MSDDEPDDDEEVELACGHAEGGFTDPFAQRAVAFTILVSTVDKLTDESVKDLAKAMLRKLTGSIKEQPAGQLVGLPGGKA